MSVAGLWSGSRLERAVLRVFVFLIFQVCFCGDCGLLLLQRALEDRYEELIYERRNMKGFANRIKFQGRHASSKPTLPPTLHTLA